MGSHQQAVLAQKIASGGFLPSDIAGLLLWLEARTLSLSDGDPVASWTALAGTAPTAAGGARPTFKVVSSRSVVRCDGAANVLTGTISITGTTLTGFCLSTLNNTAAGYGRVLSMGLSGTNDYSNTSYAATIIQDGNNAAVNAYRNNPLSTKAISFGTRFNSCSKFDGVNHTMYVNGSAATTAASSGSFNISDLAIGNNVRTADSGWFSGDLEAVLVYSGALSDTDRGNVETYLNGI